jgi:hypothetical protein
MAFNPGKNSADKRSGSVTPDNLTDQLNQLRQVVVQMEELAAALALCRPATATIDGASKFATGVTMLHRYCVSVSTGIAKLRFAPEASAQVGTKKRTTKKATR